MLSIVTRACSVLRGCRKGFPKESRVARSIPLVARKGGRQASLPSGVEPLGKATTDRPRLSTRNSLKGRRRCPLLYPEIACFPYWQTA